MQQSNTISRLRNSAEGRGLEMIDVAEVARRKSKVDELKEALENKNKEVGARMHGCMDEWVVLDG